ncbi:MAG: hypothetical protein IJ829_06615, partial [Kiritimatiellae bacterium]|nr:hypothetical protein [Kiritimatiellia bacterium]
MESKSLVDDRLTTRDVLFAALTGLVFLVVYAAFTPRGLDPALWNDMAVAAGLRPPQSFFPSLWR